MKSMRKINRQMTDAETQQVLLKGEYGILSTIDANGQPFGTPLSYVVKDDNIYFHCALEGTKLDNICYNAKVCFTVVGSTKVLPGEFSTEFESIMAFGDAAIIEGEEKLSALREIIKKYSPSFVEAGEIYINRAIEKTCVVRINITHLTGKHRI